MAHFGLSQELRTSLGQHQLLLPKMLQSIEVLQLPAGELESWLRQASEENEALVLDAARLDRTEPPLSQGTRADSDRHDQMLQNQPAPEASLTELVERQLALLDVEGELLEWVRLLVSTLDSAGFLSADDETLLALAVEAGLAGGAEALQQAQAVLRGLEPRGIGARNAIEAMVLQLEVQDPEYDLLRAVLEDFLEEVARNKLPHVARAMGLEVADLKRLIGRLAELDPRPVARLSTESSPVIHPDLVVERDGDDFQVRVEADGLPGVHIDEGVQELYRDRGQPAEVRSYLRNKLDRARWVCDAVEQRGETLLRVALKVFDHQRAFLEHGPGHLAPLRMNHLAEELGIHVSTVSRAAAGKYVQTPYGILPLRHFFQAPAGSGASSGPSASSGPGPASPSSARAGASGAVARDDLRESVRAIIAAEDPSAPVSDDEVVSALRERGLSIARRTVAKYRGELGIPSSYRRRVFE